MLGEFQFQSSKYSCLLYGNNLFLYYERNRKTRLVPLWCDIVHYQTMQIIFLGIKYHLYTLHSGLRRKIPLRDVVRDEYHYFVEYFAKSPSLEYFTA